MSTGNPSINRHLEDKAFNRIDHALGRPLFPLKESYRNYYATGVDSPEYESFRNSPHWQAGASVKDLAYFHVTEAGRKALAKHLKSLRAQHKPYEVSFGGFTTLVPAISAAKARYEHFLNIRECCPDLTFADFTRAARVRRASEKADLRDRDPDCEMDAPGWGDDR